MSVFSSAIRAIATVAILGGTFYAGKARGRYCEAKDGLMTIALNNQEAMMRLDDLVGKIKTTGKELTSDTKAAIDALTESLYKRVAANVTIRVIWDDILSDVKRIKELAGLED